MLKYRNQQNVKGNVRSYSSLPSFLCHQNYSGPQCQLCGAIVAIYSYSLLSFNFILTKQRKIERGEG